jgi:hypothetical protein
VKPHPELSDFRDPAQGPATPRRIMLVVVIGALVLGVAVVVPGYYFLHRPLPATPRPPTSPPPTATAATPGPPPTPTIRPTPLSAQEQATVTVFDALLGRYVALQDRADAEAKPLEQVTSADVETTRQLVAVLEELLAQSAGLPLGAPERELFRAAIRARLASRKTEIEFMQRKLGGARPSAEELAKWFREQNRSDRRIREDPRYPRLDRQLEWLGFSDNRTSRLLPE